MNEVMTVSGIGNTGWFLITFDVLMLIFYSVAIGISFRAYREYKGMYEDSNSNNKFMSPFEYGSVKENNL